jgi:hypothetical protein
MGILDELLGGITSGAKTLGNVVLAAKAPAVYNAVNQQGQYAQPGQAQQSHPMSTFDKLLSGSPNDGSFGWDDAGAMLGQIYLGKKVPGLMQGMNARTLQRNKQAFENQQAQQAQDARQAFKTQFMGGKGDDTYQVNPVQSPSGLQMHTGGFGQGPTGYLGGQYGEQTPERTAAYNMLLNAPAGSQAEKTGGSLVEYLQKPMTQRNLQMFQGGVKGQPNQRQQYVVDPNTGKAMPMEGVAPWQQRAGV